MEEEMISKKEYIKVVEERNKIIKILQNIFENILNELIDYYDMEDVDFNKILCKECICKICINEDCPGRLCNEDGFKCDWRGREKEPVFECECYESKEE